MARTNPLTVRFPANLKQELDDFAEERDVTRTFLVEEAVAIFIERQQNTKAKSMTAEVSHDKQQCQRDVAPS